jgi:16S rRNA processing protein RimM
MTQQPPDHLNAETAVTVGRITGVHGIRGEIKAEPLTDFPERFQPGSRLWIDETQYAVERGRWKGRSVILKLRGVSTRNEAEALPGKELRVPEAAPLPDADVYYVHDLIGLRVEDAAGEALGELSDVFSTGSNDVYVVRGERGELLLPALDDVVKQIDVKAGRIVVAIPDGIEFLKAAPPRTKRPPQIPGTDPGARAAPKA